MEEGGREGTPTQGGAVDEGKRTYERPFAM